MTQAAEPPKRSTAPPPAFEITTREEDGRRIVAPRGDIDIANSDQLLAALTIAGGDVALDLREVTFLDSSGLRAIIQAARGAEDDGRAFAIVPGPPQVQRILEIAGVADRLRTLDPSGD